MGEKNQDSFQTCSCQGDMAAFAKRYQSRKARAETLMKSVRITFAYNKSLVDLLEVLVEQVFDEV